MRIASNKIADVVRFFRDELKNIYDEGEIETFIAYCFEEYIGMKKAAISINGNTTISESELLKFNFAVKDLKRLKPIQYILGKADFYGLKFIVNEHVLIPRLETEELVHLILRENKNPSKTEDHKGPITILDIGTGSGCIAISLKKNIPAATMYAVDISEEALEVAKQNTLLNNTDIQFLKHDILSNKYFPASDSKFDIIVSNPPYIAVSEKKQMAKNVTDYEPHLALFVEDSNPLLFYKSIIDFAIKHLNKRGKIYFEINQQFGQETQQLLSGKGFHNVELIKDLNSNSRIVKGHL